MLGAIQLLRHTYLLISDTPSHLFIKHSKGPFINYLMHLGRGGGGWGVDTGLLVYGIACMLQNRNKWLV